MPYLRNDGNKHDFTHTIHRLAFEGDDEYDIQKAKTSQAMKERMGLKVNPLDGAFFRVGPLCFVRFGLLRLTISCGP